MKNLCSPPTGQINRLLLLGVLILVAGLPACQTAQAPTLSAPSATPLPTQMPQATAAVVAPSTPTETAPSPLQDTPTGDPAAYLAAGKAHLQAGETAQAIAALETALTLDAGLLEARFYLGNAYTAAGQLADAEAQFLAVLAAEPDHLSAHSNLGVVYLQMDRFETALTEFEAALALDKVDAEVRYLLGVTHIRLAQLEQAREQFEQAIALNPDLPEPYFGLGIYYYLLQDNEQAIAAFETFLTKGPPQDPAAETEARHLLAELLGQ